MSYWFYCLFKSWIPKGHLPCWVLVLSSQQVVIAERPDCQVVFDVGMLWNLSHPAHHSSHSLPTTHNYFSLPFEQQASFLQTEVMEGGSLVFCVFIVSLRSFLATPLHKPHHVIPWRHLSTCKLLAPQPQNIERLLLVGLKGMGGRVSSQGRDGILKTEILYLSGAW